MRKTEGRKHEEEEKAKQVEEKDLGIRYEGKVRAISKSIRCVKEKEEKLLGILGYVVRGSSKPTKGA